MEIKTKFMISTLLLIMVGFSQITAARNPNPGVMPINSHAFGKSYGVWGQEYSNWLFQYPVEGIEDYPLFQPDGPADCGYLQKGKVWFLYGALGGSVTRSCTIPTGKALLISLNSVTSFVPFYGNNEQEVREDASRDLDGTPTTTGIVSLDVVIDGVPLNDTFSYRASSPEGGFTLSAQEGTILSLLGFPAGDYYPAIVDGYWILLPPLSKGEHTIEWSSSGQFQDTVDDEGNVIPGDVYSYYVTWNLTVGK